MTILYFYTRFEWDQSKAVANEKKHGVRFSEAVTVWNDEKARFMHDPEHSEEEDRWLRLGRSSEGKILVVIYCEWWSVIRIISARRAGRRESKRYWEQNV